MTAPDGGPPADAHEIAERQRRSIEAGRERVALGRVAFNAYGDAVHWKTYNGQDMRQWDQVPQPLRDAWIAAATAARDFDIEEW